MTLSPPDPKEINRGAAIYTASTLRAYNLYVVRFNNRYVWRCRAHIMLRHYNAYISCQHLEVGPGTGWYLNNARFPRPDPSLTLLDLNPNSLAKASEVLRRYAPTSLISDIFAPIPGTQMYDSIAANYVFHCLPGTWETKALAVSNIASKLSAGGTFFGSTILGRGVHHGILGQYTMQRFNEAGIFHNKSDDLEGLHDVLRANFDRIQVNVVGTVALFAAQRAT